MDDNGHGTHTAGTIAAAKNGIGIVGVAPNVKIAGIKAGNADGFFFPEAVVCAFMWAGTHHIAVTNNSYFADPYLFNCKNDPVQRAMLDRRSSERSCSLRATGTIVGGGRRATRPTTLRTRLRTSRARDDSTPDRTRPCTTAAPSCRWRCRGS